MKNLTQTEIDAIRAQLALDNFWYYLVEFMEGCEGILITNENYDIVATYKKGGRDETYSIKPN